MVFIAIVVVDVYGRDCRYFVIYLYCTHKVRHGHEHTHTRAYIKISIQMLYEIFDFDSNSTLHKGTAEEFT